MLVHLEPSLLKFLEISPGSVSIISFDGSLGKDKINSCKKIKELHVFLKRKELCGFSLDVS